MTDVNVADQQVTESTTITAVESQLQLVDVLTTLRADAVNQPTLTEAVDFAIHGTITAIETGLEVTGQPTEVVTDLSKTLAAKWGEVINS